MKKINIYRSVAAGFLATGAMTALMYLAPMMGVPKMDIATMLGTITRDDGTVQATYNGWPLYLYFGDAAPGDTNGQGLDEFGGIWYLGSPAGEPILQ